MTRKAIAVIGAGWGDEGKGLLTDTLADIARQEGNRATVVRSNGGAQAGHTVVTPDGRRHVFHHVGAGSFAGAHTHLSRFFVAHPMMLIPELTDLHALGLDFAGAQSPHISIDPRAPVTTPWDAMINQVLEISRADGTKDARHGSCGLGFGETIEREENGHHLTAENLTDSNLRDRLENIRDAWMPERMRRLGIRFPDREFAVTATSPRLLEAFLDDCQAFTECVTLRPDAEIGAIAEREPVIFEGAQGLRLDMDFGAFPHVTRSSTGLRNMLALAREMQIDGIEAHYLTRAYATRHGAGPLPHETSVRRWAKVIDRTNAPNEWQGNLRFAPLDPAALGDIVRRDLALAHDIPVRPNLAITCLDQIGETATIVRDGELVDIKQERLVSELAELAGLAPGFRSYGPTRRDVCAGVRSQTPPLPMATAS